ncbi:Bis(5'-nucleosyl)-tetraphosphatase, symmetrical [Candidatus Arsenophonus lipoptenae]|uniref:Bis(5'-nucleosyl)-tetraphosphatase, symmetrical n=1 Tax=Candidatus Arsenophonus lipoptenae TaxID=634113 RepID=A0A0X9W6S4_9GAMM|nr:bis(5'-nucleosyl)-tetraphosphatase (symmetrical) ApaH [Candidatus Arsenophonus lipoptenae]AMA64972.1 Bis(5'-nucleosyl)-tetraphosphatase, symmetrical [Candidatus Arsenophonus lipoptenae]
MATYLIGDIHGCYRELRELLNKVNFKPQNDILWLTGDLVTRGPDSLKVLRYIKNLGSSVRMVLGNHDLNLISVYANISHHKPKEKLKKLIKANDFAELVFWLRNQPLLQVDNNKKIIMSHAGITPQWNLLIAEMCAKEVEKVLSSDIYHPLLMDFMYKDIPNSWSPNLSGLSRLCFSIQALTRMRYCLPDGQLNMMFKNKPEKTPLPLKPWFSFPINIPAGYSIIFGHWASLEGKGTPKMIYGLDTGCCWGGELTLLRWEDKQYFSQPAFITR